MSRLSQGINWHYLENELGSRKLSYIDWNGYRKMKEPEAIWNMSIAL